MEIQLAFTRFQAAKYHDAVITVFQLSYPLHGHDTVGVLDCPMLEPELVHEQGEDHPRLIIVKLEISKMEIIPEGDLILHAVNKQ